MEKEQARTIEVLQLAVRMEVEGKEFYQQASQKSSNRLAKDLFQHLQFISLSERRKHPPCGKEIL
jgi:rubrerythrin